MSNAQLYIKRSERKLKQSDVAKMLNISMQSYHLKEVGKSDFKQSEMVKLAKLFDATLDELFMN